MPATQQRAQSIGPSWSARGGRNARLAMRDAIRSGDREGSMRISAFAEEKGLPAQASIGSAESRMASSYRQAGLDEATRREMGAALDAGQTEEPAATTGQSRTAANMLARPDMGGAASPAEPPPVAPGATPPPENPVSGSSVPPVSDVRTRLSQRQGRIGGRPAQQVLGEMRGDTRAPTGSQSDEDEFLAGVDQLTSADGGDLSRKAAVEEMNRRRRESGRVSAPVDSILNRLLQRDRDASSLRARANTDRQVAADAEGSRRRTEGLMTPGATGSPDPNLVFGFEKPQAAPAAAPAPEATPSIPFRLGQAARSFSNANFPDTAVAAAEAFARRERSGYERIAAAGEAKVDEGIAKVRRVAGLAALRVTGRNRRTADTLRRVREEFEAGRAGTPTR
jgi:hypothetical protein